MTTATGSVGVIGAGTMGAGIAQVGLEAGWQVRLHDADPGAVERGRARIIDGLRRRARKRELSGSEATRWVDTQLVGLVEAPDLDAFQGVDLVIEAIVEDLVTKTSLFSTLDARLGPETILATNTSALSVGAIAEGAARYPERILGLHFFNPAPVLQLVEVVAGRRTDPSVLERATAIVEAWGKTAVRSTDSPGFIVNRVNRPFTIQALRMLEAGEARVAEIDLAMREEQFPMGPFEFMDLVGIDVNLAAAIGVFEGLGRPDRFRPSPVQEWLVSQGRLGRKSGVGFYQYNHGHDPVPDPIPARIARHVRSGRTLAPAEIVQRIRQGILDEAVLARDAGVASAADIDTALWLGAAHPEGPFTWQKLRDPTIEP